MTVAGRRPRAGWPGWIACANVVPVTHAALRPPSHPPLDEGRLAASAPPGLRFEVLAESPSTNAYAADRAREGVPAGLVVVTEHQTSGRGRLDRQWQTQPRSALTFSLLLRPAAPAARWPWLPLVTGLTVTEVLREQGYAAGVKWPNDVLLSGPAGERKVAGILVERIETPQGPAAVVGIGLNTHMSAEELPVPTATSLAVESRAAGAGGVPERTDLLLALTAALAGAYDAWEAGDAQARTVAAYAAACVTLGRPVRVELPGDRLLEGEAVRVDDSGQLVVAADGVETAVGAGDVIHVRPR